MTRLSTRVSVVIPTYNRRRELGECVASVQAQTVNDMEIIVVDDGSTDDTQDMVAAIDDDRIRYIQQPNGGPSKARNTGVRAAHGEFVAFQDSDDLWTADKLERQLALFADDPQLGWAYCDMSYFGSPGADERPRSFEKYPPLRGSILKEMFVAGCPMHTPTTIVRRDCLLQTRLFDEQLRAHEDHDVWFQLAKRFTVDYVDAVLVQCRRESGRPPVDIQNALESICRVKLRVLEENPDLKESCQPRELVRGYFQHVMSLAYWHLQSGDGATARRILDERLDYSLNPVRSRLLYCGTYFPRGYVAFRQWRRHLTQQKRP